MAPAFGTFAQNFVRRYWETVKLGTFPMPPNEPVQESLEELLSLVTFETEPSQKTKGDYLLTMRSKLGDWWCFTFRESARRWEVIGCSASSDVPSRPHDLLDSVYGQYFGPFIRHVADKANPQKEPNKITTDDDGAAPHRV